MFVCTVKVTDTSKFGHLLTGNLILINDSLLRMLVCLYRIALLRHFINENTQKNKPKPIFNPDKPLFTSENQTHKHST